MPTRGRAATGAIESTLLDYRDHGDRRSGAEPQKLIDSALVERSLIVALRRFLKVEQDLGVEPPVFVMPSLVGVKGYGLLTKWTRCSTTYRFDRDTVLLPEEVVEGYDEPADRLLRPAFDAMWQGAGFESCRNYKGGRWSDNDDGSPTF